ncbi:MAG: electron transport complex subunit RsxG [Xanthomonadales bacterium]|nr:electron transport complex subunit RsxG [Xanthomonadales bacterium]
MSTPLAQVAFWRSGLLLGLIALLGVALLVGVHDLTRARIAEQEHQLMMQQLSEVLPRSYYDNDLVSDVTTLTDRGAFGHDRPIRIFRARREGQPSAVIMEVVAPDGYNGDIRLLAGIDRDNTITGVRVVSHRETPGLGDPIERRRSDWIESFRGRSLQDPSLERWTVRSEGGDFEQFTGATITPRAVVHALARALAYHEQRSDKIFAREADRDDA